MKPQINIGIVGATGLVGEVFLQLLEERGFPVGELRLFASERSNGLTRQFSGKNIPVQSLKPGCFNGLQLVFFSSGDEISKEWAPQAVSAGAYAVDNSAAFRMHPQVPLVVPEVNGAQIPKQPAIIANPNCSTIQLVLALNPLAQDFGLESVHVATYQSVSGAGKAAQIELVDQTKQWLNGDPESEIKAQNLPHQIAFNCVPQIGSFDSSGFCSEEIKIMHETRKILNLPQLMVSAFTVRIPSWNAHSEAAWVKLKKTVDLPQVVNSLKQQKGVQLEEGWKQSHYPMAISASGRDEVFVGRVHQDPNNPQTWLMWIVGDNLRKGAALNGLQIADLIFDISSI